MLTLCVYIATGEDNLCRIQHLLFLLAIDNHVRHIRRTVIDCASQSRKLDCLRSAWILNIDKLINKMHLELTHCFDQTVVMACKACTCACNKRQVQWSLNNSHTLAKSNYAIVCMCTHSLRQFELWCVDFETFFEGKRMS